MWPVSNALDMAVFHRRFVRIHQKPVEWPP